MKTLFSLLIASLCCSTILTAQISFAPAEKLFDHPETEANYSYPFLPLDYNADGNIDFVGASSTNQFLMTGDGNGGFDSGTYLDSPSSPVQIADLDGDDDVDIILLDWLHVNDGMGNFSYQTIGGSFKSILRAADINGDGFIDLVSKENGVFTDDLLFIHFNNGDNTSQIVEVFSNENLGYVEILDLEGDGDLDIICTAGISDEDVIFLENDGDNNFDARIEDLGVYYRMISLIDLDCDGDLDLIGFDESETKIIVQENLNNFRDFARVEEIDLLGIDNFQIDDLDGDGLKDIVGVVNTASSKDFYIIKNLNGFGFDDPQLIDQRETQTGTIILPNFNIIYRNNLLLSDINDDDKLDIIYTDGFGDADGVFYYQNTSVSNTDCTVRDLLLSTQEEVDNFADLYSTCSEIIGSVRISGPDITNLNGLSTVENLIGCLEISDCPMLQNLSGLENLSLIQSQLIIKNNTIIDDISALSSVSFGFASNNLMITDNASLSICNINSICNFLINSVQSENVNISGNSAGCQTTPEVYNLCAEVIDEDMDGFSLAVDCDDNNAAVNPEAEEVCDEIDNNCDGQVDEGVLQTFYSDFDGDGFGNPIFETMACEQEGITVSNGDDCDDNNPEINPDAVDIPNNGIDENCDGMDATSGVEDILSRKINIYPNPTSDYLNIISDLNLVDYEIRDPLGKRVASGIYNSRISTSSIPSGKYILLLRNDDGVMIRKMFVKQ